MRASVSSVLIISLQFLFILNYMNIVNGTILLGKVELVKNGKYCVVDGKEHLVNHEWTDKDCKEMICSPGITGNNGFLFVNSCPKILPKANCIITKGDLSKQFPECCSKLNCSDHLSNTLKTAI